MFETPFRRDRNKSNVLPDPWNKEFEADDSNSHLIQELTFDLRCSFMESLPESPAFDLSKHHMLNRIWQINMLLLDYLNPVEGDPRARWLNPLRQRAFDCFRLQAQNPSHHAVRQPYGAFHTLFYDSRDKVELKWKLQAQEAIYRLIEREVAGDPASVGAMAAIHDAIYLWQSWSGAEELGMGPEPVSTRRVVEIANFLLRFEEVPPEKLIPYKIFDGIVWVVSNYKEYQYLLERLGWRFLVEVEPDEDSHELLELAKEVAEKSANQQTRDAAKGLLAKARRRQGQTRKEAIENAVARENKRRLAGILDQMRERGGEDD